VTAKEVETVAVLLKRVRERADYVLDAAHEMAIDDGDSADGRTVQQIATDVARGMQSLAAAVEMVTTELAETRARLETHGHYEDGSAT
jgi:hypothetical protein